MQAESHYIRLLNLTRLQVSMTPDPIGQRVIYRRVPTKWALLQILSTRIGLTLRDAKSILEGMKYSRHSSALRIAFKRLETFGLAVRQSIYKLDRGAYRWKLTERGKQLSLKPQKVPMACIEWQIEEILRNKDVWFHASGIAEEIKLGIKPVSGALRRLCAKGKVIRKIHPKDPYKRKIWASPKGDDSWDMPDLPPRASPNRTKRSPNAMAKATATLASRKPSMCLPANKPPLVAAVTLIVKEKTTNKDIFSAHDVTKELRGRVLHHAEAAAKSLTDKIDATALIDKTETGTVHVSGQEVAKIEHEEVREIVVHLFSSGSMDGYYRNSAGAYMVYAPTPPVQVTDPDPTVSSVDPTIVNDGSDYDGSSTI